MLSIFFHILVGPLHILFAEICLLNSLSIFLKYLFLGLCPVVVVALGIFSWGMWEAWPPALEAQSLSHWTTRKIPILWPFLI